VNRTFDLEKDDYAKFIRDFRAVLVKNENPEMVAGHLVLAQQMKPKKPKRWMYVKLKVGENGNTTTLAIRDDNLYLIGFQGNKGKWYEFGYEGKNESMMNKKLATTFLMCDDSYIELLDLKEEGDFLKKMVKVKLGKRSAIKAVDLLSGYARVDRVVDEQTKLALVCLIHMFCEATRMIPFYNTVVSCWDNTTESQCIKENEVKYIRNWGKMSAGLQSWKEKNYIACWGEAKMTKVLQDEISVKSEGEALDIVEVLLRKSIKKTKANTHQKGNDGNKRAEDGADNGANEQGGDGAHNGANEQGGDADTNDGNGQPGGGQEQTEDSNIEKQLLPVLPSTGYGKQLVEVFGVRANSGMVGTVTVCDGKRAQIIYKYHGPTTGYQSTSEVRIGVKMNTYIGLYYVLFPSSKKNAWRV
jgi:hypothetical protein